MNSQHHQKTCVEASSVQVSLVQQTRAVGCDLWLVWFESASVGTVAVESTFAMRRTFAEVMFSLVLETKMANYPCRDPVPVSLTAQEWKQPQEGRKC